MAPFLGAQIADRAVVRANAADPLILTMVAELVQESITFSMSGKLDLRVPDVGGDVSFTVDFTAFGGMGADGPLGAFTASFPDFTLGASLPTPLHIQGSTVPIWGSNPRR